MSRDFLSLSEAKEKACHKRNFNDERVFAYTRVISDVSKPKLEAWIIQTFTYKNSSLEKAIHNTEGLSESKLGQPHEGSKTLRDEIAFIVSKCVKNEWRGIYEKETLLRILHKFYVNLAMMDPSSPILNEENLKIALESLKNYRKIFIRDSKESKCPHSLLDAQIQLLDHLKNDLLRPFKDYPISLEEATIQIVTMSRKKNYIDKNTLERVQTLIEIACPMIEKSTDYDIFSFLRVLTSHSFIFHTSKDPQRLSKVISNIVMVLMARQNQGRKDQQMIYEWLIEVIDLILEKEIHQNALLLPIFENLIKNDSLPSVLRTDKFSERIQADLDKFVKMWNHKSIRIWQPTIRFVVRTSTPEFFESILRTCVWGKNKGDSICLMNQHKLNEIFLQINDLMNLTSNDMNTKGIHQRRPQPSSVIVKKFLLFMESFANKNELHFFSPLSEASSAIHSNLRNNVINAGLQVFRDETIPLKMSCCNALWIAYPQLTKETHDRDASNSLLRIFFHSTENPVVDRKRFNDSISQLLSKILEYPNLGNCLISRLGELLAPGTRYTKEGESLVNVEDWIEETVSNVFKEVVDFITKTYPSSFDKEKQIKGVINTNDRLKVGNKWGEVNEAIMEKIDIECATSPLKEEVDSFIQKYVVFFKLHLSTTAASLGNSVKRIIREILDKIPAKMASNLSILHHQRLESLGYYMKAMVFFAHDQMMKEVRKRSKTLFLAVELAKRVERSHFEFKSLRNANSWIVDSSDVIGNVLKSLKGIGIVNGVDYVAEDDDNDEKFAGLGLLDEENGEIGFDGHLNVDFLFNFVGDENDFEKKFETILKACVPRHSKEVAQVIVEHLHFYISQSLSRKCLKEISEIVDNCNSEQLLQAATQFESLIDRKLDYLSFPAGNFIKSILNHSKISMPTFSSPHLTEAKILELNDEIEKNYGKIFADIKPVPLRCFLPNQLIAVQLCNKVSNSDILLKMGTGQGKSLVLTMVAIQEALNFKGTSNKVFVFTSYNHLAVRDQNFAKRFFQPHAIESCVISDSTGLEDFSKSSVIFADIEVIERILRELMLSMVSGEGISESKKNFVKFMYGQIPTASYSIILDEYDLLLDDLERQTPYVAKIDSKVLTRQDVIQNREFSYFLNSLSTPTRRSGGPGGFEKGSGKRFSFAHTYEENGGTPYYHLYPSVFRLSQFILKAKRIIGLSGSTENVVTIPGREGNACQYFEIPSSQDPSVFGTNIHFGSDLNDSIFEGSPSQLPTEKGGIWCHRKETLNPGGTLTEEVVNQYCQKIVNDIHTIREPRSVEINETGLGGQLFNRRPILIFCDPDITFGTNSTRVWDALTEKIRGSGVVLKELTCEVSDSETQKIGESGQVTITDLKFGRGADIRVSLQIPGGLHVIVGTSVIHQRLLRQMIGRTGRMGREGSYSLIVINQILNDDSKNTIGNHWKIALHCLSAAASKILCEMNPSSSEREIWSKKWLMFLYQIYADGTSKTTQFINRKHLDILVRGAVVAESFLTR